MKRLDIIISTFVFASLILNLIAIPFLPARITIRWDAKGMPDGFMDKVPGLFILSTILALIAGILIAFGKIKQFQKFLDKAKGYYSFYAIWVMSFLFSINIHVIFWNTNILKINPLLIGKIAFIIFVLGIGVHFLLRKKIKGVC